MLETMKKVADLLIVVVLALCMTIAAVNAESVNVYLTSIVLDGESYAPS